MRRAMSVRALLTLLLVAPVGACLDSGDGNGSGNGSGSPGARILCNQLASKLRGCDLLSEGELGCDDADDSDGQRCQAECVLDAQCGDLESLFCSLPELIGASDPASVLVGVDPQLVECWMDCIAVAADSEFVCDNGESIPEDWECDSYDDCGDNSDEANCPGPTLSECFEDPAVDGCDVFECDNGDVVPGDYECDGGEDCIDGSDEAGCPPRAQLLCMGVPVGDDDGDDSDESSGAAIDSAADASGSN